MKNNDDLFQLIKTLSKEEKHFFGVYASRVSTKGDSNYVRLFTAIDQQETYDEGKIRKQFEGQSIEKFLASSKHELYGVILRSLHAQQEEESAEALLRMRLHYAEVLAAKGHEAMAREQVAEARRLAEKHELLTYMPEILHLEFGYMPGSDRKEQEQRAEKFYNEYQDVITRLENRALYERLDKQVRFLTQHIAYGNGGDHAAIDDFLAQPEIMDESKPLSVMAKYYFHHIRALCAFNKRDFEETYAQSKKVLDLSQQHPDILQHDVSRYIALLHHYANACSATGRLEEMKAACTWLRSIRTKDERLKARIFQYALNAEYNISLAEGDYGKAEQLALQAEQELPGFRNHMERVFVLIICGQTAYTFFLLEQYNRALKWLNEALNLAQVGHRDDITLMFRLLEVLLHYELGNHDLVDYRLKSLSRYIAPRADRFKVEAAFVNGIRRLTGATTRDQLRNLLLGVQENVREIFGPARRPPLTVHLNLQAWLRGKIEGLPMRECLNLNEPVAEGKEGSR